MKKVLDIFVFFIIMVVVGFFIYTNVIADNQPPVVSDLGPSNLISGGNINNTQPTMTFSITDDGREISFQIQISDEPTFENPIIDYTLERTESTEFTFRVGQPRDGGSYQAGADGQELAQDTSYYWRVRGIDEEELASDWQNANDAIAFTVTEEDDRAPEINNIDTVATENTITITWETNENADSQLIYGTSEGRLTTEATTNPEFVTSHSMEINDLLPCVTYFLKPSSADESSNNTESEVQKVFTAGCPGDADITSDTVLEIEREEGGVLSLQTLGKGLSLIVPANFAEADHDFQIEKLDKTEVFESISRPNNFTEIGDYVYNLHAMENPSTATENFDNPLEVTISYANADINGFSESTFKIYRYDDGTWTQLSGCTVDTNDKEVTCNTDHFSIFSLFGQEATPASSGGGSGGAVLIPSTNNQIAQTNPEIPTETTQISETQSPDSNTEIPLQQSTQIFSKNLEFQNSGIDVMNLQKYLNSKGFLLSKDGAGSPGKETNFFGPKTKQALIKFQEAYAEFILKPYGLTQGTGFFGIKTREYINSH